MTLDGTNTWLVAAPGSPSVIVVDPGPPTTATCGGYRALATQDGRRVEQILLTHGHADHSAGARQLAELTSAPVRAADPAHRLGGGGLGPGDVLTAAGCEIRVVATPGHSADSVCFLLPADDVLLTGDTVLGRGTTVIAGDGNLGDYLGSLDRLRALADRPGWPRCCPGTARCCTIRPGRWTTTSGTAGTGWPRWRGAGGRRPDPGRDRGPGLPRCGPGPVDVRRVVGPGAA